MSSSSRTRAGPAADPPVPVDELRLAEVWSGEAVLLRADRGYAEADAPFSLRWLASLVLQEKRSLREIGIASLTLSFLTIFPPLLVMTVVDKVLTHNSYLDARAARHDPRHRRRLRDVAWLCAPADHSRRRHPARRQAQPACVQPAAAPAARLFRAASGRRDDVQDQPGPPGPRIPHRQADDARSST